MSSIVHRPGAQVSTIQDFQALQLLSEKVWLAIELVRSKPHGVDATRASERPQIPKSLAGAPNLFST